MNKKVEVLLSTMNQKDTKFIEKINIRTDAVIINQADEEKYDELMINNKRIRIFTNKKRGLSNSRNLALQNSEGDICLLCDDDIEYVDDYEEIVLNAFDKIKDADIIIFDSIIKNRDGSISTRGFRKIKKVPFYKTYSSVLIAFKRKSILDGRIRFNEEFGTGSRKYAMCEDSLFLRNCYQVGLKAYIFPKVIHMCTYGESTWFRGYTEKYFYDVGAYLSAGFPKTKHLFKWYYPIRMKNLTNLSTKMIIYNIDCGIKGYKKRLNYTEYRSLKNGK